MKNLFWYQHRIKMEELANGMKTFVLLQQQQQEQQGTSSERLEQQLQQLHEILMQQSNFLETVLQKSVEGNSSTISFTPDAVSNSIGEVTYNPEEGITLASYFRRHEEILRNECKTCTDKKRVRLRLRKL